MTHCVITSGDKSENKPHSRRPHLSRQLDLSQNRAVLPDALGQGAGVQAVQRRHVVLLEPVSEALEAVPVGVVRRVEGHDQALDVDRRALPNESGLVAPSERLLSQNSVFDE